MSKKTLGRKMNIVLENAAEDGVCFDVAFKEQQVDWHQFREILSNWEDAGRVTCLKKRHPTNFGLYALTKYTSGNIE